MNAVPSKSPKLVVHCDRLCKSYGDFRALADCTLEVRRGDVFGLLGPNGAGKTTLIRSLLGFLRTTGGKASVCGFDPATDSVSVRQKVSYLPGDARLPTHLRGDGVLKLFAELHPLGDLGRSRKIADALELDTRRRVGFMSTGMRQKLALAVVLSPRTPLLVLDEPTANLDPSVRATVLEFVREAHGEGRTVMFSSHVLSEIEETCNRVVFLRKGVLAHQLEMSELFQRHRIWADAQTDAGELVVPETFRESIEAKVIGPVDEDGFAPVRLETSGDLSPLMPWLGSLGMRRMRIEPLGLRAVYDVVHSDTLADLEKSLRPMGVPA
ncbi:MAG: ABC transporter ATP-binding protein [Planctomycetota bacterium]